MSDDEYSFDVHPYPPKKIGYTTLHEWDWMNRGMAILSASSSVCWTKDRRFHSAFGCSSKVAMDLWNLLEPYETISENGINPDHLLWTLIFMKGYDNEAKNAAAVGGVDEKIFRKWVWRFILEISFLEPLVVRHIG